jgi:hypothetical protein
MNAQLDELISQLPIGQPALFQGESVQLNCYSDGSEISVRLMPALGTNLLAELLEAGLMSALKFEAAVALSADGAHLLLSQWIPGACSWPDVSFELNTILYQANVFRELVQDVPDSASGASLRLTEERRMRTLFHRSVSKSAKQS